MRDALEAMRDVAKEVNERKRRLESLEALAAWQRRVDGWEGPQLLEHSTQLLHHGEVLRVTGAVWSSTVSLFLFDSQLVCCRRDMLKRSSYVYKGRWRLGAGDERACEAVDIPDGRDPQAGASVRHAVRVSGLGGKGLLFCCRSAADKRHWMEAFALERRLREAPPPEDGELRELARKAAARRPPRPTKAAWFPFRRTHRPAPS